MKDKIIVISEKQLTLIHQGNLKAFIESMIAIGISIGAQGNEIESFKGPFKSDENADLMFIARLEEL